MKIECPYDCPNYIPPKASIYCSECKNGIYDGEEYIENDNGEYRHFECMNCSREDLEWLGHEIKVMEDKHWGNYKVFCIK